MATMNSGLGGASGYGENAFSTSTKFAGNNDDGSVQVDISSVFGSNGINYFGTNYTDIYINSNGLITFDGPQTGYSPSGVAGLSEPAIVPFWSDADINKGGDIYWDLDPTTGTVTITWLDVAPYSGSGSNSFQVVLTDNGNDDFDVELIYEDIQWSNGGYGVATAGITDGGAVDFELEGSGNNASVLNYDSSDFLGGDPAGTFTLSIEDGVPSIYSVDGTSGDDTLGLGFIDAAGDQITTGDDEIEAGDGNDSVDGDTGDDTIDGGTGDDTILSGSTYGGPVSWTTANNSANLTGTADQNYFSWTAENGSSATIRLSDSPGAGDGDGVADYIRVETTEQTGTLIVGDFDMGTDKIVLQEMYSSLTTTSGSGFETVTITYTNGNSQEFQIYSSDTFDVSQIFTTVEPTILLSDNDSLVGGNDADTFVIENGSGSDTIVGGEGGTDSDTVDFSSLTGAVTVTHTASETGTTTDGTDTLTFSEVESFILSDHNDSVTGSSDTSGMNVSAGTGDDTVVGGAGGDTILGEDGSDSIDGGDGDDVLTGGGGDDTLTGGDGDDLVSGGDGNDLLTTGLGQDTLLGGDGNDTLMNSAGDDSLVGGAGDDSIVASEGNDTLEGNAGNDTLIGGADNDRLSGGTGDDSMDGGDDADTFILEDSFGDDTIIGGEDGNDSDTIDASSLSDGVTVAFSGSEAGTFTQAGDTATFSQIEQFTLTDFDDILTGSSGLVAITVDGGDGNDTIRGGWGNDSLLGGTGDDLILGGSSSDWLEGGDGNDSLISNSGNDTMYGGAGDDYFQSGSGSNVAYGEAGNDRFNIGDNETLFGGNDADSFEAIFGMGSASVVGGEGGIDSDTIDLSGSSGSVTVSYTGDEAGSVTDGSDTLTFSQIENIFLTAFDDSLDGSADSLGMNIFADGGDDTISGGSGGDTIEGGTGDDAISGGAGNDIFTYAAGDGHDTITDFNTGNTGTISDGDSGNNDFIDLSGFYDNLAELYADLSDDNTLNQSNTTDTKGRLVDYTDNSEFGVGDALSFTGASADNTSFTQENTGVVCFTSGTAIRTPRGDILIDDLRVGDLVNTMDNGPQPIRWIGMRHIGSNDLTANETLRPVLIPRGFLGAERDLFVSRQHALLQRPDHLVRAIHLTGSNGVRIAHGKRAVTYIHLMFDAHQIIFAENTAAESFYPGPTALEMFESATRQEFLQEFPQFRKNIGCRVAITEAYGDMVRPLSKLRHPLDHWSKSKQIEIR